MPRLYTPLVASEGSAVERETTRSPPPAPSAARALEKLTADDRWSGIPGVVGAAWNPDGSKLLLGCLDGRRSLCVVDAGSRVLDRRLKLSLQHQQGELTAVSWSADGALVASGTTNISARSHTAPW